MFWHKAMLGGMGTHREELRGSHNPPSPSEDLKSLSVSRSPQTSPSSSASEPVCFSLKPVLTEPSPFVRPSDLPRPLEELRAEVLLCSASSSRKNKVTKIEDILKIEVVFSSRSWSVSLVWWIGIFIVGGDCIWIELADGRSGGRG